MKSANRTIDGARSTPPFAGTTPVGDGKPALLGSNNEGAYPLTSYAAEATRLKFDRPVFIVSSPRSGSTLLFETMAQARDLYTIGEESHRLIEAIPGLHPRSRGWSSNRLLAEDATPPTIEQLSDRFYTALRDRDGDAPTDRVRMLEKTPKNSLRVPFLCEAYPDAQFLYLYRDVRETLSSMLEAWSLRRFHTYPRLPDWPNTPWSLLLIPKWRELAGLPVQEVVAHQWTTTTTILLDDLGALPPERVTSISYADFLGAPQATMQKVCAAFGLEWDRTLTSPLPLSKTTASSPSADKWRKNEAIIAEIWPIVEAANVRAREALARFAC